MCFRDEDFHSDVVQWDTVNWGKALEFWKPHFPKDEALKVLDIGGRTGGLSLWFASMGHQVLCTDLRLPKDTAEALHLKHKVQDLITYATLDASNISHVEEFDIVAFKSVLGAVSNQGRDENKQAMIDGIWRSLKPGGMLFFAENLEASIVHQFFRKRFTSWGDNWNYLNFQETEKLFSQFSSTKFNTYGFIGAFGRSETQRRTLGKIDGAINFAVPKRGRYIISGICKK